MQKLAWQKNTPVIGLAPMDGWTDSPFRQICKEHGADLVFSEMIPAPGIIHWHVKRRGERPFASTGNKFENILYFSELERPFVMQIFGKKPDEMAEACRILNGENRDNRENGGIYNIGRPDEININFGCPAKSAVSSGHGVALMDNPDLAAEIVRRCVESVETQRIASLPITIKMRTGWQSADEAVPFAQKMEQAGASAIYIHGRTFKQKYSGLADWDKIYEVAKSVKIPVVGNGDITSENVKSQMSKVKSNGLAGVLIGRAARGNPWIFEKTLSNMTTWSNLTNWTNKTQTILKHANLMYQLKGEHGIIEFRKHLLHYLTGFPQASKIRQQAVKVTSIEDVKQTLNNIRILDPRSKSGMTE